MAPELKQNLQPLASRRPLPLDSMIFPRCFDLINDPQQWPIKHFEAYNVQADAFLGRN